MFRAQAARRQRDVERHVGRRSAARGPRGGTAGGEEAQRARDPAGRVADDARDPALRRNAVRSRNRGVQADRGRGSRGGDHVGRVRGRRGRGAGRVVLAEIGRADVARGTRGTVPWCVRGGDPGEDCGRVCGRFDRLRQGLPRHTLAGDRGERLADFAGIGWGRCAGQGAARDRRSSCGDSGRRLATGRLDEQCRRPGARGVDQGRTRGARCRMRWPSRGSTGGPVRRCGTPVPGSSWNG